jgi:WD40 repeat protein
VATLQGHDAAVSCVVFHPSLLYLATGGYDGAFRLWALDCNFIGAKCVSRHCHEVREGCCCPISSIAFHPSALCLATGSHDFTTKLWLISPGFTPAECVATLRGHSSVVTSVAFHPSANYLATGSRGGGTIIWTLTDDHTATTRVSTLNIPFSIESLVFHPTTLVLMTAGLSRLSLWALHGLNDPINTENRLLALNIGSGSVTSVRTRLFSPSVATLASDTRPSEQW